MTSVSLDAVPDAISNGQYCWVDLPAAEPRLVDRFLSDVGVEHAAIERISRDVLQGQFFLGRTCIMCTLIEVDLTASGALNLSTVHVVVGANFIVTVHQHQSPVIDNVLASYEDDFYTTAESGGFMLFEVVDHLTSGYRAALVRLSSQVEATQSSLLGETGDEVLGVVSDLTRSLLDYRSAVVTSREVVHEIATRRSAFIHQTTQPYLEKQTIPLERLAIDASTERAVLSETLGLYMGMVSHRTSKLVNRLTVVSMIFLPLNFLAALYGMNFQYMPELQWRFGYLAFWGITISVVVIMLTLMRRRRWI
jgi:magnesium transporter